MTCLWDVTNVRTGSGGGSPAVGEVPIQDGTIPARAATLDAYRVNWFSFSCPL